MTSVLKEKESDLVEVTWSGKKLYLERTKLDEWYSQSFEEHEDYVAKHPWVVQQAPAFLRMQDSDDDEGGTTGKRRGQKKEKEAPEQSNYVVVHWQGKSIIIKRELVEEWYNLRPESKRDFLKRHPSCEEIKA